MAGTVSNHDTIIVTKGTPHVAKAKPSTADHCFDDKKKPVVHGDNQIDAPQLGKGKTTKTLIAEKPIWTEKGWLDEIPSWPAHAGKGGGVIKNVGAKGLNYTQYAYPTSFSTDVKVEDGGVVRTDDTTKQNGGNCDGFVDGSALVNWNDATTELMKKKCTIKKITGQCSHGRKIGAPPGADKGADGFFLDVVGGGGETVTLDAIRKDISIPGLELSPLCQQHTYWMASRTGTDGKRITQDKIADQFVVSAAVLANPMPELEGNFKAESSGLHDGLTQARREQALQTQAQQAAQRYTALGLKDARHSASVSSPKPATGNFKAGEDAAALAINMGRLLDQLRQHWAYEKKPPVVNVTAVACAGAKNVKLRVFPKGPVKYTLPAKWLQSKLDRIHRIGELVKTATSKVKIETEFLFLQGLQFEFELEMKELTSAKNNRFPTEVHRAWKLSLVCEKVIFLRAKGKLGLLVLLNTVFPGAGTALDKAANAAGVEVNGFVEIELQLSMSVGGGIDEYDEGALSGTKAELVGTVRIGLEAVYNGKAGMFRAWVQVVWKNSLSLDQFARSSNVDMWLQFEVLGYIEIGADAGYTADLFNWNTVSRATIGVKLSDKKYWKWVRFPDFPDGGTPPPLGTIQIPPP